MTVQNREKKRERENIKRDINIVEMGTVTVIIRQKCLALFKTVPGDDVVGGSVEGGG